MEKMKHSAIIILISIILTNCSINNDCNNRFNLISSNDNIPVLQLDISKHPDSIRNDLNELYGFDLCNKDSLIEFKIPFIIEGQSGYLKVMTDFGYPYCKHGSVSMQSRSIFIIMINQYNMILADGKPSNLDLLNSQLKEYILNIGKGKSDSETIKQLKYNIIWDQKSNIDSLNSIFTILYKSNLYYVERELEKIGIDLCNLSNTEIFKLKEKYPLKIEFDLGRLKRIKPPDLDSIKNIELNEINEEIVQEVEI